MVTLRRAPTADPGLVYARMTGWGQNGPMLLALGVVAAARHAAHTAEGQVVDAAITDGTVLLTTMPRLWRAAGVWTDECQSNMPNGGAHYYHVYETADGLHLAVGSIEPQFYHRAQVPVIMELRAL
ncbi:CoA transferase [Streptomyces sp. MS1.AVA.3]|uniref:CoA transferase n=1 Tax=Streptomyces decoyicus TaxID=249567 RepID=UPI0030C38896